MADAPVLTVTPPAREVVLEARNEESDAETLALWLEVNVSGPFDKFGYDMYFQPVSDAKPGDAVTDLGNGLQIVVPRASVARLQGATLDLAHDGSGMVILNPNEPKSPQIPAAGTADLSGDVAQRIIRILEEQVNPSIASHGGYAQLVDVQGDTAFLLMGGGCQGCAHSKATMAQGIQVAIVRAVPEITRVIDVTDHMAGENPYYAHSH